MSRLSPLWQGLIVIGCALAIVLAGIAFFDWFAKHETLAEFYEHQWDDEIASDRMNFPELFTDGEELAKLINTQYVHDLETENAIMHQALTEAWAAEPVYIEVEKPVYITNNITTEKTVYSDMNYKPWESVQEVKDWLACNWGSTMFNADCVSLNHEGAVWELSKLAAQDNRMIGLFGEYTLGSPEWHCYNFVIIGNRIYGIEPQNGKFPVHLGGENRLVVD